MTKSKILEGMKKAVKTSRCVCAYRAEDSPSGKFECDKCGAVWHTKTVTRTVTR